MEVNDIKLAWEDGNVAKILLYKIERSTDGIVFNSIGNIAGNAGIRYQYIDSGILTIARVLHYRLGMIDNTNKITYSNIITFRNREPNEKEITKVYPNPFANRINLEIMSGKSQTINLRLVAANGYTITNSEIKIEKGNSTVTMAIPDNILSGNYVLQVITEKGSYSFKLLKK